MCRLFLGFHIDDNSIYIKRFFKQGHCKYKKQTPGYRNHRDNGPHTEGFGFASLLAQSNNVGKNGDKDWVIYKSHAMDEFQPERIPKRAILVAGHLRKICDVTTVTLENTHPFVYRDHVFFHNGRILDFAEHRETIVKWIRPKYRGHIMGHTDSEHLFYFYLTILEKKRDPVESFRILFQTFARDKIELSANFIYANKKVAIATRYLYYNPADYTTKQHPHSLYYDTIDETNGGFIISSEKVSDHPTMIPENSIIEIDLKTGEARMTQP